MSEPSRGNIIAADDTPSSLRFLADILKAEGYEVRSAINGELALRAALAMPPDLMLLDINMPNMNGFEVCRHLKEQDKTRNVPVIFVSAMSDTLEKLKGFELGAVDYVTKPYQRGELLARVRTHVELHRLRQRLEEMVEERTRSLRKSEMKLRSALFDSISAIAATVEIRDPYTAGHQRRVAQLATAIAHELGLPEQMIEGLNLASVVHDVGKIKIPAEILSKPSRLTELEFAMIKQHPQVGYEILKEVDFPWPIAHFVWQHHERLDGSGYPQGLKGDAIHFEARILAVADVIESMSSHRPYRASLGVEAALAEIDGNSGVLYDPDAVRVALKLIRKDGFQFKHHETFDHH
ncbi:MAG: response regulator [Parasulfuritortus sp.]|jgi:putative nucleotidyltransferase with HDIG domain|nr:response regulator [Parasulfuritortus sp.]